MTGKQPNHGYLRQSGLTATPGEVRHPGRIALRPLRQSGVRQTFL